MKDYIQKNNKKIFKGIIYILLVWFALAVMQQNMDTADDGGRLLMVIGFFGFMYLMSKMLGLSPSKIPNKIEYTYAGKKGQTTNKWEA